MEIHGVTLKCDVLAKEPRNIPSFLLSLQSSASLRLGQYIEQNNVELSPGFH